MNSFLAAALLDISGTLVEIIPPVDPDAVAEVRIFNMSWNSTDDEATYRLASDEPELVVGVEFGFNVDVAGADSIRVIPPPDLICEPANCTATVLEGYWGSVILRPYVGF